MWNTYGRKAISPDNGLPYDDYIDFEGFERWAKVSIIARATVELGLGTAQFGLAIFAKPTQAVPPDFPDGVNSSQKAELIDARARQYGFDHVTRGQGLSQSERALVKAVQNAPEVLVGRSTNIEGRGYFTLDNYLEVTGTEWTSRVQEVYNYGLYWRAPRHGVLGAVGRWRPGKRSSPSITLPPAIASPGRPMDNPSSWVSTFHRGHFVLLVSMLFCLR